MIELLKLSPKHGHARLQQAVESALAGSCYDPAAVRHLLNADELRHASCEAVDVGALARYSRPLRLSWWKWKARHGSCIRSCGTRSTG